MTPDELIGLSESMAERRARESGYDVEVASRDGALCAMSDIGRVRPVLTLDLVGDRVIRVRTER